MKYTLKNGQVVRADDSTDIVMLCSRFQTWAGKEHGLSASESLAAFVVNYPVTLKRTFESDEARDMYADAGFKKLSGITIPDLTNYT